MNYITKSGLHVHILEEDKAHLCKVITRDGLVFYINRYLLTKI